jgi:hypothetical protein
MFAEWIGSNGRDDANDGGTCLATLVLLLTITIMMQARQGDYLSRIAWRAEIPLRQFMLDNVNGISNLGAPPTGAKLRVCQPSAGGH